MRSVCLALTRTFSVYLAHWPTLSALFAELLQSYTDRHSTERTDGTENVAKHNKAALNNYFNPTTLTCLRRLHWPATYGSPSLLQPPVCLSHRRFI